MGPWCPPGAEPRAKCGSLVLCQAGQALAGCKQFRLVTPGSCYLCTMSLISFTELRSLLKSCVAAGPPPAVAGQI